MKKRILALTCSILLVPALHAKEIKRVNPLLSASTLPLQAPRFDLIRDSDYLPAFDVGMKQQLQEVDRIANNPEKPTFENTIAALEKSGQLLDRVSNTFSAVVQANTNHTLDKAQAIVAPKIAAFIDKIYLNRKLFMRIKSVYDQRQQLHLTPEQLQVTEIYYSQFVHNGANLNDKKKEALKKLNQQLAILETDFQQKLLAAAKAGKVVLTEKNQLAGLSDDEVMTLSQGVGQSKKYVIDLQNTTQQPLLSSLANRQTREELFKHSWNRAEHNDKNDTRDLVAKIAYWRAQKGTLFGYQDYASYQLFDQMAKTSDTVSQFLSKLIKPTTKKINHDASVLQSQINKHEHFKLQPWDWDFYTEKIRKEKYALDEAQVKPYFELNRVLNDGVFYAANQLYGITFKECHDIPVYQSDVRVFDVYDKDGSLLGMIYLDYFKRDNKTGGAWMGNFVEQSTLLGAKPVVYNVTNFTKPAKGLPALLSFDDVRTMFHEFGHALHGLFANNQYPKSNTDMARDFVEFPSQFNEHWAMYPDVLLHYARHYKTNEPLPQTFVDKIKKSQTFNQAYSLGELLAAAELDMQWHQLSSAQPKQNVDAFELQALKKSQTDFSAVPPRYRSSYFLHIWANGYPAGYYAYLWTEMLDDDAYQWFLDHGGMTRENGDRFRQIILSRGHAEDYESMFKAFYGNNPTIEPMLKYRGFD